MMGRESRGRTRRGSASRLYRDLASWWALLSPPGEYADEARLAARLLRAHAPRPPRTLLELGSGGGNNAAHLKRRFRMTLVDLSPSMLQVSRRLNPECEHIAGDMRSIDLGRVFDAVFVHDAIMHMTTSAELLRVMRCARRHLRSGGVALFAPDHVRETFAPGTRCGGGGDRSGRSARYLEWTWDPDPDDTTYVSDFAYLLRDASGKVRSAHDRHVLGLFPRRTWVRLLRRAGFRPRRISGAIRGLEPGGGDLFVAIRSR
jgi:SAM-dependent methyltransferase